MEKRLADYTSRDAVRTFIKLYMTKVLLDAFALAIVRPTVNNLVAGKQEAQSSNK